MQTPKPEQELEAVSSVGVVVNGKITGEYDFDLYLRKFEGRTVKWSLEVVE